jgi:hypothetical protein
MCPIIRTKKWIIAAQISLPVCKLWLAYFTNKIHFFNFTETSRSQNQQKGVTFATFYQSSTTYGTKVAKAHMEGRM